MVQQPPTGFFSGYRILDLTGLRGAYAGRLLADLGADVVKVEPLQGDPTRNHPPFAGNKPHPEKSLQFFFFNLNKRSMTLNLESPRGQEILRTLATNMDALIEDAPVSYLKDLSLDFESLRQINPRLVMLSITDFGQTGPYAAKTSSDLVNMAMSGFMQASGEPDGTPLRLGMNHSYLAAGLVGAYGLAAALPWQRRSGEGQHIDVSALEAAAAFISDKGQVPVWRRRHLNPVRAGRGIHMSFPSGLYKAKDGWLAVIAFSATSWDNLARWITEVTGDDKWLSPAFKGPAHARAQYADLLNQWFTEEFVPRFTVNEFFHEANPRGITAVPVYTAEDIVKDPHLRARGFFQEVEHPSIGPVQFPRLPYYCAEYPWRPRRPAPLLGEHTREILCVEMGYSATQLDDLKASVVI